MEGFAPAPAGIRHCDYNDIASLEAAMGEDVAAIVLEPIPGEGGVSPADPEFLHAARELPTATMPLIFDEAAPAPAVRSCMPTCITVVPDIPSSAKSLGVRFLIGVMLTTSRCQFL